LTAETAPPAWLTKAKSELPLPRRSTLGYLNVQGILERVQPLLQGEAARVPENLGLTNVQALYSSTGMDDVACVTKGLIAIDGPPRGIFALLPHHPLAASDLQVVPQDATVALALRLDPRQTLDRVVDLVVSFDPRARQEFADGLWKAESELGIDIKSDLLATLDDKLVLYMPSGEVLTSWTGTAAALKIKDRRRLERTIDKLAVVGRMRLEPRDEQQQGVRFRESEFEDYTLHYLQFVGTPMPFTPSWCVTDEYLIAGLTPQAVKTAISRLGQPDESLAEVEPVAAALGEGDGPAFLGYADTQRIFRGLYPMFMWGLQAASGELARQGFELDLALVPSVDAVAPHLVPAVSTWRATPEGFRFDSHQSLPGGDLVASAPFTAALVLPAATKARFAARETQEMNNLRMLALAFHNYTDVHNRFPSNIYDVNGKALLSWRVQLLPYLEQDALYRQFHLDEPWDSPHNRPLLEMMPPIFQSPASPLPPGRTRFVAFVHDESLFPGDKRLGFADVTDGTSNTLMFVQAGREAAVEWTRPDDLSFNQENAKQGLMQPNGRFLAAFGDGSVRRISLGIGEATLRRLVFRNDGEPIDHQELEQGEAVDLLH
jgi:hypothetical protein